MFWFVVGVLFGGVIASGSLYAVYFWRYIEPAGDGNPAPVPPPAEPAVPVPTSIADVSAEAGEVAQTPALESSVDEQPASEAPAAAMDATAEAQWLGEISHRLDGELGSHSFRLEEITASLRAGDQSEPEAVREAAARILLANQQLQTELALARSEIDEHRARVVALTAEARTDVLTGLANRRAFLEDLERRFQQWLRHKVPLSLIMVDVDHFKSVNDHYTHAGGDAALKHMGEVLRGALRQMDIPSRYGGEEFAIILPGTKMTEAINVAERLRATVAAKGFEYENQLVPITASFGVASVDESDTTSTLIERADQALYAAKEAGRNRAFVHDGAGYVPILLDKQLVRHPFRDLQQIAQYKLGGPLPAAHDFFPVRCYDLSVRGISFLSPKPPEFQALVIRLGHPPDARYMISSIANVTPMKVGDENQYRVGCTFVSRLDPEEIALADGAKPAPAAAHAIGV